MGRENTGLMLDIKFIREHTDIVKAAATKKNVVVDIDRLLALDTQRIELQQKMDTLRAQQNEAGKQIAQLPADQKQSAIDQMAEVKESLQKMEEESRVIMEEWTALMYQVPNVPSADTPVGKDEEENVVLKQVGEKPVFDFAPQSHWDLAEGLDILDTARATKISGSRFVYLKGDLVRLQFALINYIMGVLGDRTIIQKIIAEKGLDIPDTPFTPVLPPMLVRRETMDRMGRSQPEDDRYVTTLDDMFMVGSAEHSMGPMYMDETLQEEQLPIRYIGYSSSFRREAGTYGKDTQGLIRQHQFDKLEMETFSTPETGMQEQELIIGLQEYIVSTLGVAYQVMHICTGDMGKPDYRQIDIESWMPAQDKYRETHTSDYMTTFQSRRLQTFVKRQDGKRDLVHMNDATACAVGRMLAVLVENYQNADGSITIPEVLRPYMGGQERIGGAM